jgi:Zn-finger nucleic acid-binding protein/ribosomal protein L40E
MRLVACANCHTQYDVSGIVAKSFPCRCGETLENRPPEAVDAQVHRCGSCGALVTTDAESCQYCGSAIVRDPGRLSLICPECYARNADESRFCTACGVAFSPEPIQVEGAELPCPVCSVLMPLRQVGGLGVNECRECHGLWAPGEGFDAMVARAIEARKNADPAQLEELAPRVTGSNPAAQSVQYRKCPECDAFMHRRNFRKSSGVIIDRCAEHGTWLDADELEQIAGFILSGGSTSPLLRQEPRPRLDARSEAQFASMRARRAFEHRDSDTGFIGRSIVDVLSGLLRTLS